MRKADKDCCKDTLMRRQMRRAVLMMLGDKCCKCGFSDPRALQIDHINSDGAIERAKVGYTGTPFYKRVMYSVARQEDRYQLLCCNCNWIKREEAHEVSGGRRWRKEETDGNGNRKDIV